MNNHVFLKLSEWSTAAPSTHDQLKGFFLEKADLQKAERLSKAGLITIQELRTGLQIVTNSRVGRMHFDKLTIEVVPKIKSDALMRLTRYAFSLKKLNYMSDIHNKISTFGPEDILVWQLNYEIKQLLSRGLIRSYRSKQEELSSPRGRILINKLAQPGSHIKASLPCRYYSRHENHILNQVILAGLKLAHRIASDKNEKFESARLASIIEPGVSMIKLDITCFLNAKRQLNRLSDHYSNAFTIIELILNSVTCSIKGEDWNIALPGFMFDMNRWFQCLLSKFLNAHLQNYELKDEEVLNEMMKYRAINGAKPKKKVNPRPDFAVFKDKKPVIFLDAKYRDLNEKPLPSNMLYQLAIYAISLQNAPRSAILYPAASKLAKEDLITIHDPSNGNKLAEVFIRPVRLEEFDELLNFTDAKRAQRLNNYAHYLAFGEKNN